MISRCTLSGATSDEDRESQGDSRPRDEREIQLIQKIQTIQTIQMIQMIQKEQMMVMKFKILYHAFPEHCSGNSKTYYLSKFIPCIAGGRVPGCLRAQAPDTA